jgi:dihydrosphingosine 1-phosphate phosphatase
VGPQSEIDVWEQLDYRDEQRRRRSSSIDRKFTNGDVGNHFHDRKHSQSYADEALEIEEDSSLLRAKVEEPRLRYDVEVVTKLIVYWGTRFLVLSSGSNCRHRIFERRYTTGCISFFGVIWDIGIE